MKNNKKLIWKFLNGEKIDTNNYNFYIEDINIANDKELYYKCPKKVKQNYMFVLYIIEKFQNDIDFINEVAQNYLSKTSKDNYTYQELTFIMSDLIDEHKDNKYSIYNKEKNMIYNSKRKIIDEYLEEENEEDYGLGFIIVGENEKSEVITNYFASKFIEDIFYNMNELDLEKIIHMNFKEKSEIIKYGIDRYIIEYIDLFDEELSYYVEDNIYLIDEIKRHINFIINNWNNYIEDNYHDKLIKLKIIITNLLSKYNSSLSIDELYQYIDKNNPSLPVKLYKGKPIKKVIPSKNININDYRCFKESLIIADKILLHKNNNKPKQDNKTKAKILKFKPI